jgi:regulator of protease activity HflC (stomatin/prohibitin superfamily)
MILTDDLVGLFLVLLGVALFLILSSIHVVPAGKCMVLERFGQFSRVVSSGIHFLPLETPKQVSWSYQVEKRGNFKLNLAKIPLNNCQLDCVPYSAKSQNGVYVTVNGTLHYKIVNPKDAVYETDQLLSFLEDCVAQSTRVICSKHRYDDLIGKDYELATEMITSINEQTNSYGVECVKFMVQSISANAAIEEANQKQMAAQKKAETARNAMQKKHELDMMDLELKRKQEESHAQLKLQQSENKIKLEMMKEEAKMKKKSMRYEVQGKKYQSLIDAGIPGEKIPSLFFAKNTKNVSKVIMMGGGAGGGAPQILSQLD